ncbi:hypothetical protein ANCDUO_16339, partial [Ancylostoma duodenale]
PLSQCPNVIHTPHASWFSDSSCKELRVNAAKEVRRAILNRFPNDLLNCVNKEQLLANGGGARRALAAAAAAAANQPGPSSYNPLVGMQNFGKLLSDEKGDALKLPESIDKSRDKNLFAEPTCIEDE